MPSQGPDSPEMSFRQLGDSGLTVSTVGPALMDFGTEEQKREFLPRILAGECHFSIGYSEPNAGTTVVLTFPAPAGDPVDGGASKGLRLVHASEAAR